MRLYALLPAVLLLSACDFSRIPGNISKDEPAAPAVAPQLTGFLVEPYLQSPGPDHMTIMFEPEAGGEASVEYRKLGEEAFQKVSAANEPVQPNLEALIETPAAPYTARLAGLTSNTTYEYRVTTSAGTTPLLRFKTWPVKGDGVKTGRFMVISDVQGDFPARLKYTTENGLIAKDCKGDINWCVENVHGIIIPGDIVNDGDSLEHWRDQFFGNGRVAFRYIPVIPAVGNHDYDLKHYLIYFDLPDNGSLLHREEWYRTDFLNLRLLTMQTNLNGLGIPTSFTEQNVWALAQVAQAAQDESVDYFFMQMHHPCKSEFWIPGENIWTCFFQNQLERVSANTGKLTGHLFGHTHAYSRGQSRDVPHLWMNVGASGGAIDDFGDYEQADYDEYETSWDEYGYSMLEFATEGPPEIRTVRRNGGDDHEDYADAFSEARVRDVFVIGGDNQAPTAPVAVTPTDSVDAADVMLHALYSDPDGDELHEAQWQLRTMVGNFDSPLLDAWGNETRAHNWWFRRDLNSGVNVDWWRVPFLTTGSYCWRVRYRDARLAWSPWSQEACFEVNGTSEGDNLVVNGGAEDGNNGWTASEGRLDAAASCRGIPAASGSNMFIVGGCQDGTERGRALQSIDISTDALMIDAGQSLGVLQAQLRTFTKWDVPTARFRALDAQGQVLAHAKPLINQTGKWLDLSSSLRLPAGTRRIEIELGGVRQDGTQNDSYIDDVRFHLVTQNALKQSFAVAPVLSPGNGMALIAKKSDLAAYEAAQEQRNKQRPRHEGAAMARPAGARRDIDLH